MRLKEQEKIQQKEDRRPKKMDVRQDNKAEPKNKITAIQKYLEGRKDLHFGTTKLKDVAEFIASKLDAFMCECADQIIEIAKVSSKRNSKTGN